MSVAYRAAAHCKRPPSSRPFCRKSKSRSDTQQQHSCGLPTWITPVRILLQSPMYMPIYVFSLTHRRELAIHPRTARQEARAAVQSRRRPRLPFHPPFEHVQGPPRRRRGEAARALAPELARLLPTVRIPSGAFRLESVHILTSLDARRYASDLTPDQKDALLDVVRVNPHPQISAEVRRELVSSVERGAPRPDADGDVAMA